jgi:hypothetical protein
MSGAAQFKSAVPERSGPKDWRGGFERERRKAGQGRAVLSNRRIGAGTIPLMDLPAGFSAIAETAEELQSIGTGPHALRAFRGERRRRAGPAA